MHANSQRPLNASSDSSLFSNLTTASLQLYQSTRSPPSVPLGYSLYPKMRRACATAAAFLVASLAGVPGASAKLDKWGCNPSTGYPHCACKHACIHVTQWQTPEFACCMAEPDDDGAIPPPADSACEWQAPGYADTFYDLQMFGRTGGAGYAVAPGDGYRYKFGVCEVVSAPPTPGCVAHPPSSASVSAAFQAAVSGDASGTCYSLGQNAQKSWALTDAANPAGGVTLRYFGGTADNCPGFARSIELAFSCGDDYSLAVPAVLPVDEPAPCVYRLALKVRTLTASCIQLVMSRSSAYSRLTPYSFSFPFST